MNQPLVVITGGSRGIGAACVEHFAKAGYRVAFTYERDAAAAATLITRLEAAGYQLSAEQVDQGDPVAIDAFMQKVDALGNPFAGVVINAGITGRQTRLVDLERTALDRLLAVNVTGALWVARAAGQRLLHSRGGNGGAVVFMSSIAARLGGAGEWVHYAASKGAIDAATIGLAREWGGDGVRVNAVAPGLITTDLHAASGDPGRLDRLAPLVPMARAGTPDEVAAAALWLFSEQAAYVTGAIIPVSGGR